MELWQIYLVVLVAINVFFKVIFQADPLNFRGIFIERASVWYPKAFMLFFVIIMAMLRLLGYTLLPIFSVKGFAYYFMSGVFWYGMVIVVIASLNLKKSYLPSIAIRKKSKFISTGLYKNTRHPQYLGYFLATTAIAFFMNDWVFVFINLFYIFANGVIRLRDEEDLLVRRYGIRYIDYRHDIYAYNLLPFLPIRKLNLYQRLTNKEDSSNYEQDEKVKTRTAENDDQNKEEYLSSRINELLKNQTSKSVEDTQQISKKDNFRDISNKKK